SPEEMELISQKMEEAGTDNKRAYLRKMALDGYIVNLEMDSVKDMVKLMRSISSNINQIAVRCNETGNLYEEDVRDLRSGYLKVQTEMLELVQKFTAL
ncbi:MAG: plasmid mobilization relaxosome protein MobC, partial [Lachnospiraceae bacterium]|nr:plasmid mobilization relaxosome protein MobC [Lachnospiraceae bacterium]